MSVTERSINRLFLMLFLALGLLAASAPAGIKILKAKGNVEVRHNVQEEWLPLSAGTLLAPDDAVRSGAHSSLTLLVDGTRKISVPDSVVLDLSDIRSLTKEELLLKLTVESVRSLPREKEGDYGLPFTQTSSTHSPNMEKENPAGAAAVAAGAGTASNGRPELNGTRVLYRNGFYATCALRAKQVFNLNPGLAGNFSDRLMVASALEKMKLQDKAQEEYREIGRRRWSAEQSAFLEAKIRELQRKGKKH